MNSKVIYKVISITFKLLIAASSIVYIYIKLIDSEQLGTLKELFLLDKLSTWKYISAVLLLMILNWAIEVIKWKILVKPHEPLSYLQSTKSVLAGVTMSVFTPNRVGEFAGKIFFLQKANRLKALVSSVIGSFSQLCVTLFFGFVAASLFFFMDKEIGRSFLIHVFFLLVTICIMMLYVFPARFTMWLTRIKKWHEYTSVISLYSGKILFAILQLSFVRYIVFSIQYFLLLKLFGVEMSTQYLFMTICLTFLAITVIPTITITELSVRGSASLYIMGAFSTNHPGIVAASFALWIINIAIPAFIGLPFIFNLTFFRRKQIE